MPSLEVVWLIIGFVPAMIADKPPVPVIGGGGAVYASAARCETVAQEKRNAILEIAPDSDVLVRCMPYWIDKQTTSAIRKRHRS